MADTTATTVAFFDIGTNSMRMLLSRIEPDGSYVTLTDQKESIRLGEGEFQAGRITEEAIQRALTVGHQFVEMAKTLGATEFRAVATSATREATNRDELVDRFQQTLGIDIHVISGMEEARLIYMGVISEAKLDNGDNALLVDIGGGSTEMIIGNQQEHLFMHSVKVGAIRMANQFCDPKDTGPVSEKQFAKIKAGVRNEAIRTLSKLKQFPFTRVIGSSGTIQVLVELAHRLNSDQPVGKDDRVTAFQVRQAIRQLLNLSQEDRVKLPALNARRADIIVGGAAIFECILDEIGDVPISISDRGLRDGLLVDYLHSLDDEQSEKDHNYRRDSVMRLGRVCRFNEEHAQHITDLSLKLYDSAAKAKLIQTEDWTRELLEHAAMLHDIGKFISYSGHGAHAYYLIRNAELLGFDDLEVELIANIAQFHKKPYPKKKKHPNYAALNKPHRKIVKQLCMFLRLAESLDRTHKALVSNVKFACKGKHKTRLAVSTSEPCPLEEMAVNTQGKAFAKTFKRELTVVFDEMV
ncbi:MAG: HD domain-containing protein [Phycisphaeraceae bacterium JB051]